MDKSTGITRRVDNLGRVVLPVELRRALNIGERDSLEIYIDGEKIILRKHEIACVFCGNTQDIGRFQGKLVCRSCFGKLKGVSDFHALGSEDFAEISEIENAG